jgi:serine protease DegS
MKLQKWFSFVLTSITAGLAAAIVVLVLRPELLQNGDQPQPPEPLPAPTIAPPAPAVTPSEGPVSYAAAVKRAAPSVVNIFTTKIVTEQNPLFQDPLFQRFFGDPYRARPRQRLESSLGSGVILDAKGYILTNNHVIEGADEIQVVLHDGRNVPVVVVGADPDTDMAVLYTRNGNLPAIQLGDSESMQVGDVVLAIGNPFGVGQTVTMGIVSATGRNRLGINTFEDFIQTDAAINPGNSGGALINARGELVGINTAIFSKSGGSQGIGFAIPASLAQGIMQQLLVHGRVIRGWLGIMAQDITPELAESFNLPRVEGVLVSGVLEQGPADLAGLEPGDIITSINDQAATNAYEVMNLIAIQPTGTAAAIEGWRGNQRMRLKAVVAERPPPQPAR